MRIGTKSLLFGVHQFAIHPIVVALAWKRLYGWPRDVRIWCAFVVHDWGYWGCRDMDGEEGERHPYAGAQLMGKLFGTDWYRFCLYHSRHLARALGEPYSQLCVADKAAIYTYPRWLYLLFARASGEIKEYHQRAREGSAASDITARHFARFLETGTDEDWYDGLCLHMCRWVDAHKDGAADTWILTNRQKGEHAR